VADNITRSESYGMLSPDDSKAASYRPTWYCSMSRSLSNVLPVLSSAMICSLARSSTLPLVIFLSNSGGLTVPPAPTLSPCTGNTRSSSSKQSFICIRYFISTYLCRSFSPLSLDFLAFKTVGPQEPPSGIGEFTKGTSWVVLRVTTGAGRMI
jgi:hypothetical protein